MRIAFLHIPKTAGQSIHHSLTDLYPADKICPARTNEALYKLTIEQLKSYDLFSGHLDWSIIKQTGSFNYVFTVLRDPLDRILSFYFYLRKEAVRLHNAGHPIGAGMKAAMNLSPEEYFVGTSHNLRSFLDNHYNNFYSYFFASGGYSGFSQLSKLFPPGSDNLADYAMLGISSIHAVYTLPTLPRLESDMQRLTGKPFKPIARININQELSPDTRADQLTKLANGWDWRNELSNLTVTDNLLFKRYSNIKPLRDL